MMAMNKSEGAEQREVSMVGTVLRVLGGSLGTLFCAGATAGLVASMTRKGEFPALGLTITVGFALLAILGSWYVVNTLMQGRNQNEVVGPKVKRSRAMMVLSGVIGGAIGLVLVIGQIQIDRTAPPSALANGPIPMWTAIFLIVVILTLVPWLTWQWHRSVDEHESEAYRDGTVAGIYAYSALSICWWLGWRGGLFVAPDGMAIFFATYAVWSVVWLWRRYR